MMRIEKINSLIGISNYVSDYIVKGVSDHSKQVSQLKFFKKRYAISKSCIRPKKITQKADPKDDRFKEVYNTLNNDDYEEKEISL